MTVALTRVYRAGDLFEENFDVTKVSDHLALDGTTLWIDLCKPSKEQLAQLAEELGLHELAVEDALSTHQRPKLDRYDSHLFLSCHTVRVNVDECRLETTEVDAFIGGRWLVTVRKDEGFSIEQVVARWDRSPKLAGQGVGFLLYGLLDVVIDGYFEAVQTLDEFYEGVSEEVLSEKPIEPARQRQWFVMRQVLIRLHRLVVPMREAVSSLMRREQSTVTPEMYPYFQDVYDHILRVTESSEALRDLAVTIAEMNLSMRDYRQNLVMKKVTSWAGIAAVPTLITGFYGMNVPFPGDGKTWGFTMAMALCVAAPLVLFQMFRRRGWL